MSAHLFHLKSMSRLPVCHRCCCVKRFASVRLMGR
ncbi:unnamed protein product [Spirodela intermedia]|uniref:Uncharacterized protein n=1 Tax=Spirodela intermedia TaxID=51605 RepID=A0A7I8K3T1_SPIIN|nr:unnamed protein product [Spirodela intermedia]